MLSERIYKFRRKSGLSQEQLAEKIGVPDRLSLNGKVEFPKQKDIKE